MTTLVLGASGPIGRALSNELESSGRPFIGVSRSGPVVADILDPTMTQLVSGDVEALAYLVNPRSTDQDVATHANHLDAFRAWLDAVESSGSPTVLLVSSSAVYGTATQRIRFAETSATSALNAYARLKLELEAELASRSTIPRRITARVFNAFGPGCDDFLVNRIRDGRGPVWNTDEFARDYLHVDDIAHALRLLLDRAPLGHGVWNIGSGTATTNADLLAFLPAPLARELAESYAGPLSWSEADVTKLQSLTHFEAQLSVEDFVKSAP